MEVTIERFNPWRDSLIAGIFLLVIGILLAVLQSEGLRWILIISGILAAVMGVFTAFEGLRSHVTVGLVIGVIMFVIGVLLIVMPNLFQDILMILLAAGLIVIGLVTLLGMAGSYAVNGATRIVTMVVGALMVVLGIVALLNLEGTADTVMIIIGVLVAIAGVLKLYDAYQLRSASA